jgi:HD domain
VTVATIGMIIGALPHLAVGRPARVSGMATRLLCVACVAHIFRPLAGIGAVERHWGLAVMLMTSLAALAMLLEAVLTALLRVDEQRARFRVALVDEMRVQLPLGAAVGASALLIAFAAEVMGLAALGVFTAPLLVTQVAFRRYAGIRATYLQTVRALAKVTEIGGYVETGHSERVSRLAVAIGRELGIHEPQLLELEYAALMHDIGQLSLRDPIPGGATVLVSRQDQQRIAELGADVIQQAQVLGSVAEIVRRQNEPYRDVDLAANKRNGHVPPSRPPLSSRIIKAANAFDDLVGSSLDPGRAEAAVQRLRLDTASEYDPDTVEALSRVVNRRSIVQM